MVSQVEKQANYILGLDVGIASVGWAAVEIDDEENPIGLIDVGVRTFEKAEVPKTGESLALARRLARGTRRLIARRVKRLTQTKRLLKREGVLSDNDFATSTFIKGLPNNVWELRVAGLTRPLNNKEWAAVLLHLVKHRGYLSQRKSEKETTDKELGALLSGVNSNHQLLQSGDYQTPAELALNKFYEEKGHIRNQRGSYAHTFNRLDLQAELKLLFSCQRAFGNPYTSGAFEQEIDVLLMTQKPALSGEAILKMLGNCTFEKQAYKAAKNTYSAERFVWLTKLNNLRILEKGEERALTEQERQQLITMPYEKAKLTYEQVRKALVLSEQAVFKGLRYREDKKVESTTLMELKAWHQIRKALDKAGLKTEWQGLATRPELLDEIGTAFSLYKTDDDITAYLGDKLQPQVLEALLGSLNFSMFIQLSLPALAKLLPLMAKGCRYDEACKAVYGDHFGKETCKESLLLPKIDPNEIRNPVVLRALTQVRKIINAIVRRYGSPARVHIETGREVGKSYKDRREIEKQQKENQTKRQEAVGKFKELFPYEPKTKDILALRLYKEQQGKCLYSGKAIDLARLIEANYVQIDHVLPFSRTWDDSFNNKVLVLTGENQEKGNQTPYEWLNGAENSERWKVYTALVMGSHFSPTKKQRLLTKTLDEKGFRERNLNDTRYVARFLMNHITENMYLSGKGKQRVFASNGQITALLRNRWGLKKEREANDRHHAIDAIVVACTSVAMQQKINAYYKHNERMAGVKGRVDPATGEIKQIDFPVPWTHFRKEVNIRVFDNDPRQALLNLLPDRPQALHDFVSPLFVSRAETRKMSGQGHQETIRSPKRLAENISISRVPLTQLKLKALENMVNREREKALYEALKARLMQFNDDPAKAFAEPFFKKGGQQVKAVRVEEVQKSGVLVPNRGVADNASIVRVDVFEKQSKFFLVPIYTWQVAKGILPNKAVVPLKEEAEWQEMDESYRFKFSLYPNDLVKLVTKKALFFGYYNAMNRWTASINIKEHDMESTLGKDGIYLGIGVKTALSFEKYQVDPLGKVISICKPTRRLGVRE